MRAVALLSVAVAALTAGATAQATPANVLRALEGSWSGSGTLLGRPAAFTMRWELGEGGFARLSFTNAFLGEDGAVTPALASEATYLVRGDVANGVWIDTRPQRITLEAALTDSTIVARWTAPAEEGRTEYVVRSSDSVVVRDFVYADGGERLFAEATYRRGDGAAR